MVYNNGRHTPTITGNESTHLIEANEIKYQKIKAIYINKAKTGITCDVINIRSCMR